MSEADTIMVFSPHPDDETLGCGGTIARRLSEGFEVFVVVLTDGRHAYSNGFKSNTDTTPEALIRTRRAEVERAMEILGLEKENLIFLDFEDGTLEQNREETEIQVTRLLKEHSPAEVYYPYERDFHVDHRAANRIVKNAIKKAGLHTAQYEYSISRKYRSAWLSRVLDPNMHNTFSLDISDFLPLKEKAVSEFKSQIAVTLRRQKRPIVRNLQRFMGNKEIFFIGKCSSALIISYAFPPCTDGGSTLMYNLCKYLPKSSFIVITAESDLALHRGDYDKNYVLNCNTIRLPVRTYELHDGFKFSLLTIFKGLSLSKKGDIDCFLSVHPYDYDLFAGYVLSKLTGKPFVIYMHDLFSELRKKSPLYHIWKLIEKRIFSSASRIIVTNETFKDHYLGEGIRNVVVLHSCVDLNENFGQAISPSNAGSQRNLRIAYTGSVYAAQEDTILYFLEATKEVSDIEIVFATASPKDYLKKVNVGFVPKKECYEIQRDADVLLLPLSFKEYPEEIKCAFPCKVLEYCAAGKPILAIVPRGSFMEEFIKKNSVGIAVTELSKEKIICAIEKLKDEETRKNFSKNALNTVLFFDAKVQAKQFHSIIQNCAREPHSSW